MTYNVDNKTQIKTTVQFPLFLLLEISNSSRAFVHYGTKFSPTNVLCVNDHNVQIFRSFFPPLQVLKNSNCSSAFVHYGTGFSLANVLCVNDQNVQIPILYFFFELAKTSTKVANTFIPINQKFTRFQRKPLLTITFLI